MNGTTTHEPGLVQGGQGRDGESVFDSSAVLSLCLFFGGILLALGEVCSR